MGNKLPYDVINSGLKTIAGKLDAELPVKKYSNVKDEIAGTVNAIAGADIGGGGGGGGGNIMEVRFTLGQNDSDTTANKTFAEILEHFNNGGSIIASIDGWAMLACAEINWGDSTKQHRFYGLSFRAQGLGGEWSIVVISLLSDDTIQMSSKTLS